MKITKPTIELKKVKTFLGREGYGLNADVYINGVKAAFVRDDASGGEIDFDIFDNAAFKVLTDYAASLPAVPIDFGDGPISRDGKVLTTQPDAAQLVDEAYNEYEKAKFVKGLGKKMMFAIMIGVPGANSYREVKFKIPLAAIDKARLQGYVNEYKTKLKKDEVFLNTNFAELGITI